MISKNRVQVELQQLVQAWQEGQIADAVALATFPYPDIPAAQWSFSNRVLMALQGTGDARGFHQWKEVGRHVQRGRKAFYILGPRWVEDPEAEPDPDTGQRPRSIRGFYPIPVFAYEDTEGTDLPPEQRAPRVPDFPLREVARRFQVKVRSEPFTGSHFGAYHSGGPGPQEIRLATPEEKVFFHELAHAAHERVNGALEKGQDPQQEIVAELAAAVLCRLAGRSEQDFSGNCYRYIQHYAERTGKSVTRACLDALHEVGPVLAEIFPAEG